MSLSRLARLVALSAVLVAPLGAQQADSPKYSFIGTVPNVVGGQGLRTFATDPVANRLYAGSNIGLYWVDLSEATPRIKGPLFHKNILKIEIAVNIGRLFYATADEIGYVDLRDGGVPVKLVGDMHAWDMAYEPTRRELYVSSRASRLMVFDARSGERAADIALPS